MREAIREQAERRVGELRAELHKGQQALAELEARQTELRQTLLRISGAIQVLEELLSDSVPASGVAPASDTASASGAAPASGVAGADGPLLRANGNPTPANAS